MDPTNITDVPMPAQPQIHIEFHLGDGQIGLALIKASVAEHRLYRLHVAKGGHSQRGATDLYLGSRTRR